MTKQQWSLVTDVFKGQIRSPGTHTNKTNETLCVSVHGPTQTPCMHWSSACTRQHVRTHARTDTTPASDCALTRKKILFKWQKFNPTVFRWFQAPLTHIPSLQGEIAPASEPWFPPVSVLIEKAKFQCLPGPRLVNSIWNGSDNGRSRTIFSFTAEIIDVSEVSYQQRGTFAPFR